MVLLLKKLFIYLKGYLRECILGPLFKLLEASFELIVPLIVASMIDRGILMDDKGWIIKMSLALAALALIGLALAVVAQYFSARAAIGVSTKLRHALMEHIQTLGFAEIDKLGTSTLITRMTSDVNQVQSGVNMGLRLLLRSPFVVFGAMVMAFTIDVSCALIFLAVAVGMVGDVFLALRQVSRGLTGALAVALPVIPVWGGVLTILSTQRKAPLRPFVLTCVLFMLVCTTATLLTWG